MSASIAVSPLVPKLNQTATITLSGAAATTSYVLTISHPNGWTETHTIKTNGSGTATQVYVPSTLGATTYNVDPVPTTSGSTATSTANHGS